MFEVNLGPVIEKPGRKVTLSVARLFRGQGRANPLPQIDLKFVADGAILGYLDSHAATLDADGTRIPLDTQHEGAAGRGSSRVHHGPHPGLPVRDPGLVAHDQGQAGGRQFRLTPAQVAALRKFDESQSGSRTPEEPDVEASGHADTLLRSAENLEKAGKNPGAIEFYQRVVKRYPNTKEAQTATGRLRVLGGEVPSPDQYEEPTPTDGSPIGHFTRPKKRRYVPQEAVRRPPWPITPYNFYTPTNPARMSHLCGAPTETARPASGS